MKIMSTRPCLRLRTNLYFGVLIWVQNWTQSRTPKYNPGRQTCTKTPTRCWHDLHSMVFYLAILFNCAQQTNNFNQRRGKLRPGKLLKQKTFLHFQTKHGQDSRHVFLAENIRIKFHVWENQQHARYFEGTPMRHRKTACFGTLVLEPHFDQILGPCLRVCLFLPF